MIETGRDIKLFTGAMDQDTEARYMKQDDYRYLLNGRTAINSQGTFGAVEDVMGNVLVPNPNLPPGINKVVGSYEDIAGQSCIYFVYNSNGFHGIYRWFANSSTSPNGTIQVIYKVTSPLSYNQFNPDPLNFQPNRLITGINLVENLLFWTDGFNSPRMINIDRANETNKKRIFNVYFNKAIFNPVLTGPFPGGLTFFISIYQPGLPLPIATLSWNDFVLSDIQTSVSTLFAAYLAAPGFQAVATITNKINYVQVELNTPGIYIVDFTSTIGNVPPNVGGYVVPENFYPDITSTTVFYQPTSYQLMERVKYPPFCSMDGEFDPYSKNGSQFAYTMDAVSINAVPVGAANIWHAVATGVYSILYDTAGVVTGNPHQTQIANTGQQFNGTANSYISNNNSFVMSIDVTIDFSLYLGPISNNINIYIGPRTNPTQANSVLLGNYFATPGNNLFVGTFSGTYSIPANSQACIWFVVSNSPSGAIANTYDPTTPIPPQYIIQKPNFGYCTVYASMQRAGVYNPVTNIFPEFRAKYIYKDFQESVYGAISECIVTDVSYKDRILLDFSDRRLADVNLASDVSKVVLAVSYDNGTTWFDFDTLQPYEWIGQFNQLYTFDNLNTQITVAPAEAILPYHNVPLLSKSQEYIGDRIFDGAVTTGYDSIPIKLDVSIQYDDITSSSFQPIINTQPYYGFTRWRRGYKGYVGIVYYDDADRKSAVCVDPQSSYFQIPNYNQDVSPGLRNFWPAYLNIQINNNPPDWATKYHLVRSKDLSQTVYLIFSVDDVQYVDSKDVVVAPNLARFIKLDFKNIIYYTDDSDKGTIISFTYVSGDRIKFIQTAAGVLYDDNDYEIAFTVGNFVYIRYDASISVANGVLVELYSPQRNNETPFYYEYDTCYEIQTVNVGGNIVKIHTGNVANQVPSVSPAIIDSKIGNVWYRSRQMFYNTSVAIPAGALPPNYIPFISSNTPSDFTGLIVDNDGRVNSAELKGELYQPTGIIFSNQYISNTEINGLSAVEPLSTRQYSVVFGDINKMQVVNNDVLKLIFGNSYQLSIYVDQAVLRQTQSNANLVSLSDDVAGNSHIIQRTLGTINAESVVVNDEGDMFGYDENEGVVWVSSGNGLIQISDRGMKSIFKRYSNERKSTLAPSYTPSVYDLFHDEYIITLNEIQNAPGPTKSFPGVTIAYNKQKGGWTSYYSFVPDYYGRVRDYIVSFVKGQLYLHDRSNIAKEFYGTQFTRELTFVTNKDFPKVRDFKAISINGIGQNDLPTIRVLPFEGYPNGMLSLLTKRFFKTLEGVQYAYFQKDKLTPGMQANQINALANGRNLKGQVLEVTLVNDDTTKSSIYSSEIIYFYSEHS